MWWSKSSTLAVLGIFTAISQLIGCGGGGSTPGGVSVAILPATVSTVVHQSTFFVATVRNTTNTGVTWTIVEENGGQIADGLYTAPLTTGTYHIVATSKADPTKKAIATAEVSASFAFLHELRGTAPKYILAAMLGTFRSDGKFTSHTIDNPATGKPFDIGAIFLSSDGRKVVFVMDGIYTADVSGVGSNNVLAGGQYFAEAQFTPDGNQIIYTRPEGIWMMNANGTDQHLVYSILPNWHAAYPTISPDGKKIAVEISDYTQNTDVRSSIVLMNSDGTNAVPLTTAPFLSFPAWPGCLDRTPTFTNDGNQIVFSRVCYPTLNTVWASLYTVNLDGTNLRRLYGDETLGIIHFDPLAVADKVVFLSNMDNANSRRLDLYSINLDGTGLTRHTADRLYDAFNSEWWDNCTLIYVPNPPLCDEWGWGSLNSSQ